MARGRMISSTVATDKRFNSLSADAALVYMMAIPHLDRDGLILGDAMPFWGKVCPRRTEYMEPMDALIGEWVNAGLVLAYECDEGRVLFFYGFGKNQTGMRYDREAPSLFPAPVDYIRTSNGLEKIIDGATPDELRRDDGATPPQSKVKESNGNSKATTAADDWRAVVDSYHSEIGVITESISGQIKAYYDEVGGRMLIDAFEEASRNNVRKWSYVDSILKKWRTNGRQPPPGKTVENAWEQLNGTPDYMRDA